jgi:hypothetical protein
MPFSKECLIKMSDGTSKRIDSINTGDSVMDMYMRACKITKITKLSSHVIVIALHNNTETFKMTPDQPILAVWTDINQKCAFRTLNESCINTVKLKCKPSPFDTKSICLIGSIDESDVNLTDTVYSIEVASPSKTFFANGVIAKSI